jgi:membrane-bound lytic murein transglycosylase A
MPQPAARPLQAARWSDLPGWNEDELVAAWPAFLQSCRALASRPQWPQWKSVCEEARGLSAPTTTTIRRFFESRFLPWRLTNTDGTTNGLVTGYYEPLLRGSRTRSKPYLQPVLGVPPDLLTIDLGSVLPDLKNMRLRGRLQGNKVVPYFSRAEITAQEKTPRIGSCSMLMTPSNCSFSRCRGQGESGCRTAAWCGWRTPTRMAIRISQSVRCWWNVAR